MKFNSLDEVVQLHVKKALEAPGHRWIFNSEMGVAKTSQTIHTLKELGITNAVIACPAIVRSAWVREFKKWWPDHPVTGNIFAGRKRKNLTKAQQAALYPAYEAPIKIVSYNLLRELELQGLEALVYDECHRLKSAKTKNFRLCRAAVLDNPNSAVFGLTATLMPDQPLDACNIAEAIWPGRFGGLNKAKNDLNFNCKRRYANASHNGYGWEFKGINSTYASELQQRIAAFSSRTTKQEVEHLLPPFQIEFLTIPPKRLSKYELKGKPTEKKIEAVLAAAGREKFDFVPDWLEDSLVSNTHVCILTHLKETAAEMVAALRKVTDLPIYEITGSTYPNPEKRNAVLAEAASKRSAIIVATMHSVGIGIDLTFCTDCLMAELYYRPETVVQALGRFSRFSSKRPSRVTILAVEGTLDEVVADKLLDKLDAIGQGIKHGLAEEELIRSAEDDGEMLDSIMRAIDSATTDGYSLRIDQIEED